MGIEFGKTFGAAADTATTSARGASSNDRPKAQFWLNIGYDAPGAGKDGEDMFVSLPVGIPLDTQEHVATNSRNEGYAQFQAARNNLLDQIMAVAGELGEGESKILNLQIQLRKVSGEREAPAAETNPFVRQLAL